MALHDHCIVHGLMDAANVHSMIRSDWEGKGPCPIVPFTWKMAHQSLCRMIRNCPLNISKSLKKAENGPLVKISSQSLDTMYMYKCMLLSKASYVQFIFVVVIVFELDFKH